MPSLGTLTVTTYRQEADSNVYALAGNSVSQKDLIALRRTLPTAKPGATDQGVLRTNMRFERTVPVGETTKSMTFNISGVIPVGVDVALVQTYLDDVVEPALNSAAFTNLAKAGDIYLGD